MSRSRLWTFAVLGIIITCLTLVASINLLIDANGVFRDGTAAPSPNMSVIKMNHLLRHPGRYTGLLFGSSRAGNIDIRKLPGNWYNLFFAAGLPEEYLEHLRVLLASGMPVREVLVSLDDFSYFFDPQDHLSDLDLQPHPAVSGKSSLAFYAEYLFRLNKLAPRFRAYIAKASAMGATASPYQFDLAGSGMLTCIDCDARVERNRTEHERSSVFLKPWEYRFRETDHEAASLRALQDIVLLSRQHGIRTIFFINPIHRTTYLNAHLSQFARFKQRLAGITDYYDFSGLNAVTTGNYYYYETSHYRPLVGDMMLNVMLGMPDRPVPHGFGVHVTAENIASHLADLCAQVREIGNAAELTEENRDYAASPGQLPVKNVTAQRK